MASIDFIPRRINDAPVVFRGMTMREVAMMAGTGFAVGLVPGIVMAIVMGMPALSITLGVAVMGLALFAGGTIMRRLRRGRSPAVLYRQINYRLAAMGFSVGRERLITRSGSWRTRRDSRGGLS